MSTTNGLLFPGRIVPEEKILELYWTAYNLLLQGKTYMEFSGEGTEMRTEFPIPVATMLSEAAYALQQINPERYGNILTSVKPQFV